MLYFFLLDAFSLYIHSVRLMNCVIYIFCIIIFPFLSYQLLREVLKSPTMTIDLLTCNFFFFYIIQSCIIKSIQDCYISWENCSCYVIILFIPDILFDLRSVLSNEIITMPDFSWLVIFLMYLFPSFLLSTFLCHYVLGVSLVNSIQLDFVILSNVRICLLTGEFSLFILIVVTVIFGFVCIL